jgi:endonuclease/exonuclease/phosphatase family metal-dependent hydrolase
MSRTLLLARLVTPLLLLSVPQFPACAWDMPADAPIDDSTAPLSVLTWNVYMGTVPDPVLAAGSPDQLVAAVARAYSQLIESDFPARAGQIADRIAEHRPDLIALQEVSLVRRGPANDPAPATDVVVDYLAVLTRALRERGVGYAVAGASTNFDAEFPGETADGFFDIRLTDRDVVLVLDAAGIEVTSSRNGNFHANLVVPSQFGPVEATRGWVLVEAEVRGRLVRFLNTHLQPFAAEVQERQARELLELSADGDVPVILTGDLNSAADRSETGTYGMVIDAGFSDAWAAGGAGPGATCCQSADLRNPRSQLHRRIDFVLFRGSFVVAEARLVGEGEGSKTPSGLWPSDHAGVFVSLRSK